MGDLLEQMAAAKAAKSAPPAHRCTIARIIDALKPAQREDLDTILADRDYDNPTNAGVLTSLVPDLPVKQGTVGRHRGRKCSCFPNG